MLFCVNSRRLTRVELGDALLLPAAAATVGTAAAAGQLHRWNDKRVKLIHVDDGQSGVGGGLATRHRLLGRSNNNKAEPPVTFRRLQKTAWLVNSLWLTLFLKGTHVTQFWRGPTLGSALAGTQVTKC